MSDSFGLIKGLKVTFKELFRKSKTINYPLVLKEYALERSPHSLVHFVKDFSATFHSFYEQNPVLCEDKVTSNSRLLITSVTKQILKNSFKILNVEPLEKM